VIAVGERQRLPNRRWCSSQEMHHHGTAYHLTIGIYADGQPGEVFIDGARIGSGMYHLVHDVAVLISIAMQHRVPLQVMADAVARVGASGTPHSIAGAVLDSLLKETAR
jgi:ribonucleoside-diphosphate reductase alpha chain